MIGTTLRDREYDEVVYVTQHESATPTDDVEHDEALVRAIVRAIQQNPKLHAMLRMALEHRI